MSGLVNISDQLKDYLEENVKIIKKVQKETNFTLDQIIKCAEIAAHEMIADDLFHIGEKLESIEEISDNLSCLDNSTNIDALSCSVSEIADEIHKLTKAVENLKEEE